MSTQTHDSLVSAAFLTLINTLEGAACEKVKYPTVAVIITGCRRLAVFVGHQSTLTVGAHFGMTYHSESHSLS